MDRPQIVKSSRPGELPPEPLTEPYVTVSRHTALVISSPAVANCPVVEKIRHSFEYLIDPSHGLGQTVLQSTKPFPCPSGYCEIHKHIHLSCFTGIVFRKITIPASDYFIGCFGKFGKRSSFVLLSDFPYLVPQFLRSSFAHGWGEAIEEMSIKGSYQSAPKCVAKEVERFMFVSFLVFVVSTVYDSGFVRVYFEFAGG